MHSFRRRFVPLLVLGLLVVAPLSHTGCAPRSGLSLTPELDDPDYRRGKELLRMGREQEGLALFLKVIDKRGGTAADSHLEAGILYQKHIKDPIAAIYHYRRYRELKPGTEQATLVLQSIESCIREFARTLPARPLDNQVERTDLMDAIDRLQRENLQLKEQLVAARAAVLETTRQVGATGLDLSVPPLEPSQGGYVVDVPAGGLPGREAPMEYAAPVGVTPVAPPPPAPPATPPPAAGMRRHIVARGDTLMSLANRYYGNRSRWRDIYAVNRDVLPSENALRIGMELKIPQ